NLTPVPSNRGAAARIVADMNTERALVIMSSGEESGILPVQVAAGARWTGETSGPRALMLAVLEDAVRCIVDGRRRRSFHARGLAADADAGVRCDRRDWLFSFVNICDVLGFDADALRQRLSVIGRVRVRAAVRIRPMSAVAS